MVEERFEILAHMVWGIHGNVQRLKLQIAQELDIKSVHVFLIYLLRNHPQGLTATELCEMSRSTEGLISRETAELLKKGLIAVDKPSQNRRYRCKYLLTESGKTAANRISEFAMQVQSVVSAQIPREDLRVFYRTFGTLLENFDRLTGQSPDALGNKDKGEQER